MFMSRRKFELGLGASEVDGHSFLQHVVWAPRGNALAFVYRNDIYYKTSALTSHVYRVTGTGRQGVIFNGVPDWLYEGKITKYPPLVRPSVMLFWCIWFEYVTVRCVGQIFPYSASHTS
jgi:hypothetical protein